MASAAAKEWALTPTERDTHAATYAAWLREVSSLSEEQLRRDVRLLRHRQETRRGDAGNPGKVLNDEDLEELLREHGECEERINHAWGEVGKSARELSEYDAAQFRNDIGIASRAVGAATVVVAGILVQVALQVTPSPAWFGWGFLSSAIGIGLAVSFYFGRAFANFNAWWRIGSPSRFKLFKVSFQRGVTAYEIMVLLGQLAALVAASAHLLRGLNVPGFGG